MNLLDRMSIFCVLAIVSVPLTSQRQGNGFSAIAPKQLRLEFSRGDDRRRRDYIYSNTNKKLYVISLEPQFDVGKHIVGVDLVLRDSKESKTEENLLYPPGNWHGLQPYNFVANDLAHGKDRSVFREHRNIEVKTRALNVEIQIQDVRIGMLPDGTNEIEQLTLSVSVENSPR